MLGGYPVFQNSLSKFVRSPFFGDVLYTWGPFDELFRWDSFYSAGKLIWAGLTPTFEGGQTRAYFYSLPSISGGWAGLP